MYRLRTTPRGAGLHRRYHQVRPAMLHMHRSVARPTSFDSTANFWGAFGGAGMGGYVGDAVGGESTRNPPYRLLSMAQPGVLFDTEEHRIGRLYAPRCELSLVRSKPEEMRYLHVLAVWHIVLAVWQS